MGTALGSFRSPTFVPFAVMVTVAGIPRSANLPSSATRASSLSIPWGIGI